MTTNSTVAMNDAWNRAEGPCPMRVGDRVLIERDESRYPSKGTCPQFRGKTGTIVEVNADRDRPHLTEFGMVFSEVALRSDGRARFNYDTASVTW